MIILGIDTSTKFCNLGLIEDEDILIEYTINSLKKKHSSILVPAIKDLLETINLKMEEINGIAVSIGPGSFTGLRIGLCVARGIFSNEAGLGSASMAHAVAKTPHPARQGTIAMVGVLIDTLIICSMTGIVIVMTKSLETGLTSTALTAHAFASVLGGIGGPIVAIGSLLFGYSTIITWCYYGQQCARYIVGPSIVKPYAWLFVIVAFLGAIAKVPFIWLLTDMLNGAMAIPNLIGLLFLSGVMAKELKDYFSNPELLGR